MRQVSWACVLILSPTVRSDETKRPEPPKGFSWKKVDQIKATFLMPEGWHFRLDTKGKTTAAFITKEKIEDGKPFQTGLSVNVLRDQKNPPAELLVKAFVEGLAKLGKIQDAFEVNQGKVKGSGGRLTVGEKKVTMHFLVLSNTTTNTVYLIQFESPEKEWEEAWKKGREIMKRLVLDDEF